MRDLVYYIATSIDGFIADPSGDFSQFPTEPETLAMLFARYPETCPAHLRDALGVRQGPARFDTVLMGRATLAPAEAAGLTGGAYPHLRQIVVTRRETPQAPGLEVMAGDVAAQVAELKSAPGADIWLCGGAQLAGQLIDLIDEIQLKVNPVLLVKASRSSAAQLVLARSTPLPASRCPVASPSRPIGPRSRCAAGPW